MAEVSDEEVRIPCELGINLLAGFIVFYQPAKLVFRIGSAAILAALVVFLDTNQNPLDGTVAGSTLVGRKPASALKRLMPNVLIVAFSMYAELLGTSLPSTIGIDAVIDKLAGIGKVVECARSLLRVVAT